MLVCLFLTFSCATDKHGDCPSGCTCSRQTDFDDWDCSNVHSLDQLRFQDNLLSAGHRPVKNLHLRNSFVGFPEDFATSFPELEKLSISNSSVHCSGSMLWLLTDRLQIENQDRVNCTSPDPLNGTSITKALQLIQQIDSQCPKLCSCALFHVPRDNEYVSVNINCTGQNFTQLPNTLPANFSINLDLSNNKVSNKFL